MSIEKPLILYVVNVDWFFLSHRLPLALAAQDRGAKVVVAAGDTGKGDEIRSYGFDFVPLPISRMGTHLLQEVRSLLALWRLYRGFRPSLVHHVSTKPVLYGTIAARLVGDFPVINALTGLGYTFAKESRATWLQPIIRVLYRVAFRHPKMVVIFQNPDDRDLFIKTGLLQPAQTALIRGSGVDCEQFQPTMEPAGDVVVMLPSRLLWDKGVGEFVRAARFVKEINPTVRFVLVGAPDSGNPTSVSQSEIQDWVEQGVVEWWGYHTDMPRVISMSHIVVLPSYREGLPKVLLEAAACGKPLVATDVPGCREIVRPGENGFLVPPRDHVALAQAILSLVNSADLRHRMGKRSRAIVEEEFRVEIIVEETMALYARMLGNRWPGLTSETAAGGRTKR